jgi:hypothetical protein
MTTSERISAAITKDQQPTAAEYAQRIQTANPNARIGYTKSGGMVGCWDVNLGRFVSVLAWAITGQWVIMDYEIRINGELPQVEWIDAAHAPVLAT